jgi:hypothetical protein
MTQEERNLTDAEIERLDTVHNLIFDLIRELNPNPDREIERDMEMIGDVSDAIEEHLVKKGICTDYEFAPYITREN